MITSVNTEGILTSGYQSTVGPIISKSNSNEVYSNLNLDSIRFPGGNLGNLYHPFVKGTTNIAPGYGFRKEEFPPNTVFYNVYADWDKTQTENMIFPFMRWLKNIGVSKVLYVANVKNGTVDEVMWVIDTFTSNGFEICGVELGNELYFAQWGKWTKTLFGRKSTLMTPEEYINFCTPVSNKIREKYPDIKQAVLGWHNSGNASTSAAISLSKSNDWNSKVSKVPFKYEAYVVHDYLRIESTDSSSSLNILINSVTNLTKYKSSGYLTRINKYFSGFFQNKEKWWTELNVEDPFKMIGNTVLHGAIMMEAMCESKYQGVDLFCFHNLGNLTIGMSMTWSPKEANRVNLTSFYYTNIIMSRIKDFNEIVTTTSDGEFFTWHFKRGSENVICYVNKTTNVKTITIPSTKSSVYAISGSLGSSNRSDSDSIVDPAFRVNSKKTGTSWSLSEFSIVDLVLTNGSYNAGTGYGIITW